VINFRYHVVSLTAVFLALAIGLVVGTAALNGPAADVLNEKVNALSQQNQQYREQVSQLEAQAGKNEQFATDAAPTILGGKLVGRKIVVVSMPSTDSLVADTVTMLSMAGATVSGRLVLEDKFTDPANNANLLELANNTLPLGVSNVPLNSNGSETASYLLASVLLDRAVSADALHLLLNTYQQDNYLHYDTMPTGSGDAVLFLAAQPYIDREADQKNAALLTIATEFDAVGGEVVAATGVAGSGNIIKALRGDPTLSKSISTVDNANTPEGRIAAALSLADLLTADRVGHYGVAAGSSSMLPTLSR
jgi:hypothetical protein